MKHALLALILSFSALADDYHCPVGLVKLELSLNDLNSLIIQDAQTREFIYHGIASDSQEYGNTTDLMFETRPHSYLQLRFKSRDLQERPVRLMGLVRGFTGRGFLDQSLTCVKKVTAPSE
jgi:hypothetical protein